MAGQDLALMDSLIRIQKHNASHFEDRRSHFESAWKHLHPHLQVFNPCKCVHKVLLLINSRGYEHLGSCTSQFNLCSLVCVMIRVVGTPKHPCGGFSAVDGQLVVLDASHVGGELREMFNCTVG